MTEFSIIVAHDDALGIGKKNTIPWKLQEDLEHFKKTTLHGIVIMGRNTYESLPQSVRPLPMRENIVLSRDPIFFQREKKNVKIVASFDLALENITLDKKVFIIGGQTVYHIAINHEGCKELIITRVKGNYQCDTFFPHYTSQWKEEKIHIQNNTFSISTWKK